MPRTSRTRKRHELDGADDDDARPPAVATTRLRTSHQRASTSSTSTSSRSRMNHTPTTTATTTNTSGRISVANPPRSPSSASPSTSTPMYAFSTEIQIGVTRTMTSPFNINPVHSSPPPPQQQPPSSSVFPTTASTSGAGASSQASTSRAQTTTTTTAATMVTRTSHGKKRDASYIPRPPNAFILFRSSFIRSQRVPGNVEGNHSTLSKIIGKCWQALPPEERERWEKEAVAAQAEHRKKYPDWRFRPGANAAIAAAAAAAAAASAAMAASSSSSSSKAKWQVKEGSSPTAGRTKRRAPPTTSSTRAKEKDKDKGKGKDKDKDKDNDAWEEKKKKGGGDQQGDEGGGGGDDHVDLEEGRDRTRDRTRQERARSKPKPKLKDKGADEDEDRLAKIAALLLEGMKGRELEVAVEEWEEGRRRRGVVVLNSPPPASDEPHKESLKTAKGSSPPLPRGNNPGDYPTPSEDTSDEVDMEMDNSRFSRESTTGSPSNSSSSTAPEMAEFSRIPLTHWFKRERSDPGFEVCRAGSVASVIASSAFSTNAAPSTAGDEQNSWWVTSGFETDTTGLGYDPSHTGSFGHGFGRFPFDPSDDESGSLPGSAVSPNWTKTPGGFVAAIVDPFLDEKRDSEEVITPCTASAGSAPVPVPVPMPMPISVSIPVPCPSSTGLGPCVCPSLPSLAPLSSISASSSLSPLSGTTATASATSASASGNTLDSPLSPLLFPSRVNQTQSHSHSHSHSHPPPHPHSHTRLQRSSHHTRSSSTFSSLADWDGAASAPSPLPSGHIIPIVPLVPAQGPPPPPPPAATSILPADEAKPTMYGIQDPAYSVGYYAPVDWSRSYG